MALPDIDSPPEAPDTKHEANSHAARVEVGSEDILVWWDEPDDQNPENPMNWSSARKWVNIIVISVISFLV